jgi:23S rRNA (cytosine1962-C5)-methyltransferase
MVNPECPTLVLAPGRERSLVRLHPWIFSGAVAELRGTAESGETVRVCAADGSFLAWAAYSPGSRIAARVWDFDPEARIDAAFFERRLAAALELRRVMLPEASVACARLVHAESDGLPGLVVDRYGDRLVLAASSAGAARHRESIAACLAALTGVASIYERSDSDAVQLEGLSPRSGPLLGGEPETSAIALEAGLRFTVDVRAGHKTGFYLDQRDNRALVRALAHGRDVLDCFSYSGGFALNAVRGGAKSVLAVDSSEPALALCEHNAVQNGMQLERQRADVFEWLRKARDSRRSFDLIVLDPPKLAPSARLAERAARAYKDLNLLAFKLLRPGGLLATFSCSGGISPELFQKIVAGAAVDAGVDAKIARKLQAGPDHPIALQFPEGEYLKGLLCRVV